MFMLGGVYMRKFAPARVSYRVTFWFCILFTWWLGHFISRYLNVHFMSINYTCDTKSQTLRIRYPFQSTVRPIFHRSTVARFRTRVKFSPRYNNRGELTLRQHDILWWYHVNKCRAMRGNRSELAPGRKSPRCHVNTPLERVNWISVSVKF